MSLLGDVALKFGKLAAGGPLASINPFSGVVAKAVINKIETREAEKKKEADIAKAEQRKEEEFRRRLEMWG